MTSSSSSSLSCNSTESCCSTDACSCLAYPSFVPEDQQENLTAAGLNPHSYYLILFLFAFTFVCLICYFCLRPALGFGKIEGKRAGERAICLPSLVGQIVLHSHLPYRLFLSLHFSFLFCFVRPLFFCPCRSKEEWPYYRKCGQGKKRCTSCCGTCS